MYTVLNIGGQDYKLEFSVEASLYAECMSEFMSIMAGIEQARKEEDIKEIFAEMSNVPQTALTVFYAGLLEAHGTHEFGDSRIPDKAAAKKVLVQYIKENDSDFYGVLNICAKQMEEDGFLKLIGLERIFREGEEKEEKEEKKTKIRKQPLGKSS